jgi:hypothetical protein
MKWDIAKQSKAKLNTYSAETLGTKPTECQLLRAECPLSPDASSVMSSEVETSQTISE